MHLELLWFLIWADVPWTSRASQWAMSHFEVTTDVGELSWVFGKWSHSLVGGPFSCKWVISLPKIWEGLVHAMFRLGINTNWLHWINNAVLNLRGTRLLVELLVGENAATAPARVQYAICSRQTHTTGTPCWVSMLSLLVSNIMILFEFFVQFLVLLQSFKSDSWLRCHDSVENSHVFLLKPPVCRISLIFFDLSHIISLPGEIGTGRNQVIRWSMKHLG